MPDDDVQRVVTKQEADSVSMSETGTEAITRSAGVIREEFLSQLRGQQGVSTYKEMRDNDPVIGAYLFAIKMLIRQAEWRIEPPEDAEDDEPRTVFIRQVFNDMERPWDQYLAEILSFLTFGWSAMEKVFKQREEENSRFPDGKIGLKKLGIRPQDSLRRWRFDDNGELEAMLQFTTQTGQIEIPRNKFLLFRPTSFKNNPEGRSILRNAYRPWFFKKRIEEIEGVGIERDMAGLPVGYLPPSYLGPDTTDEQEQTRQAFETALQNMRNDEQAYMIIPSVFEGDNRLFDIKLMSAEGSREFRTSEIISRYDRRIAMTVLADFLLVGHQNVGSFALAESKSQFFMFAIKGFLDSIEDPINRKLIPQLLRVNGFETQDMPKLSHASLESLDLQSLGSYIRNLVDAGVLQPDADLESFARSQINMPEDVDEDADREPSDRIENDNPDNEPDGPREDRQRDGGSQST